jgi:hypothetical protein
VQIDFMIAMRKVAPTSFFGAVDIGFSQWGLEFVNVALYTMTKVRNIILKYISKFIIFKKIVHSHRLHQLLCSSPPTREKGEPELS